MNTEIDTYNKLLYGDRYHTSIKNFLLYLISLREEKCIVNIRIRPQDDSSHTLRAWSYRISCRSIIKIPSPIINTRDGLEEIETRIEKKIRVLGV